jgi:undecaprenyl phosphate-alpha-L-ara4N flippase subunit ArnE
MLNSTSIMLLVLCAVGLSLGQILFKIAARSAATGTYSFFLNLGTSPSFLLAIALYGSMTFLWTYILTTVPLSKAYPFAVLSFVFVPLAAAVIFHEPLTIRYGFGIALIVTGLLVAAS